MVVLVLVLVLPVAVHTEDGKYAATRIRAVVLYGLVVVTLYSRLA